MTWLESGERREASLSELMDALLRWQHRTAAAAGGSIPRLPSGSERGLSTILDSLRPPHAMRDLYDWEAAADPLAAAAAAAPPRQQHDVASPPSPPHRIPPSSLHAFPQPAPCAFLRPGQVFEGRQRVAHHHGAIPKQEHWEVKAVIQHYDPRQGYVAGTMEASNVPDMPAPVTTFFEGEVVDNQHHSFYTADWDACADTDFLHWSKFESFKQLHPEVVRHGGRCPTLAAHPYIYMRWKEQFFVQGSECRLTIAGFYYLALHRVSGRILGYYYDPSSSPDQRLELTAVRAGPAGFAFPHYELA